MADILDHKVTVADIVDHAQHSVLIHTNITVVQICGA